MTPRIAEVMMTRLAGCLNFDDSLWHQDKRIVDVILEDDFDPKVMENVHEIVFVGLGRACGPLVNHVGYAFCLNSHFARLKNHFRFIK